MKKLKTYIAERKQRDRAFAKDFDHGYENFKNWSCNKILHITEARYLTDYKVQVFFNDGKEGVADLSGVLHGPVFDPLKDKKFFAQLRVDKEME